MLRIENKCECEDHYILQTRTRLTHEGLGVVFKHIQKDLLKINLNLEHYYSEDISVPSGIMLYDQGSVPLEICFLNETEATLAKEYLETNVNAYFFKGD